jgi:exopolysaccharide production protein ExoY
METFLMSHLSHASLAVPGLPVPLWKRALDWLLIFLALPLLLPLVLVIAGLIKLRSPGPLLFTQTRVGRGGQPFVCYKFRTMKPDASSAGHARHLASLMASNVPMTKLDCAGDPRIIPGGRLLRSSGLDELPQLFNVLKGEMSLVGPRPCLPYEAALYTDRHRQRLQVLPGLTGLWQVSGKNHTSFEEMIDLDVGYARRMCLALDLSIVLRTFGVLFRQLRETLDRTRRPSLTNPPVTMQDRTC